MNLMEIIRSYELAEEGTIGVCGGMAMCASCQVYVINDPGLEKWVLKKMPCWQKLPCKRQQQIGLPAAYCP
jgi:ferredoxin